VTDYLVQMEFLGEDETISIIPNVRMEAVQLICVCNFEHLVQSLLHCHCKDLGCGHGMQPFFTSEVMKRDFCS
jgi:hypothetical protein